MQMGASITKVRADDIKGQDGMLATIKLMQQDVIISTHLKIHAWHSLCVGYADFSYCAFSEKSIECSLKLCMCEFGVHFTEPFERDKSKVSHRHKCAIKHIKCSYGSEGMQTFLCFSVNVTLQNSFL